MGDPNAAPLPDAAAATGDEAGPLSPKGREAVIRRILTLMEFWAISPAELGADVSPPPAPARAPLPPKYRHPVSGETWDGTGEHPQWLRNALLTEGYTVQQLREAAQV